MTELPPGVVTFLFTDIEGSTRLLDEVGEARYEELLAEHRIAVRDAFSRHGGVEVDTQGDASVYVFAEAGRPPPRLRWHSPAARLRCGWGCTPAKRGGESAGDLTPLGEHRLKDFDEPVALFQLGSNEFPAAADRLEHEPAAAGVELRRP